MTLESARGRAMLGYLPPYYGSSRVMAAILQAQGAELDMLRRALDAVLDQVFVARATWGLDTWERELGLPVAPEATLDQRRERIIARLRGLGTATIGLVRKVAESYEHGDVAIIENQPAYTVVVRFIDSRGVPANMADLQAAIRAVLPAHLEVAYEFTYLTWAELDARSLTWDALDALGLDWPALEVYI